MQTYIVIGAGILGASTAYHLAKQGVDVTLVDRNDVGQATNAAAGIVCPWLTKRRNKAWYRLAVGGAKYYPTLIQELEAGGETETGYARVGAMNIFDTEEKLDKKMELAFKRKESTPEMGEISKLSPVETKALFPPLSEEYGAVHVSGAARVNGGALRNALIRCAEKNGATFIHGDASLVYNGAKITGVTVNEKIIHADQVIVTGGAWSKELLEPLGMNFLVTSQKAQIVHLNMPNTDTSFWPVVIPPFNQYMLAFNNGKIVLGATHENNVGMDYRVTMGGIHEIMDKALRVAPGLASSTYVETKVGFRPFTPNHLPVIGPVPNTDGLFVANGLGASGLTSGPYLGSELAKLALGHPTELDLNDYDVSSAFS
ncbi:FAD-binding oxidoreductase [Aquibacillus sp. 3ASR75-11]|uniref:FAD-binding oxidoreductase n=1 Tax=Terrihalobacillus insolitus TaxID=2950438 RepID=A0A9X3WVX5_9BACI|nr:FAD-binding oxidoreductase [Terrihalobacillus insolitus]MDC3414327.1 FAD-binding oxidoreductase [Terrihalobacillus insolitus]MDC3425803.1 FAD-binding oxidoreductase [Terrihalobacillus insolitus]